MITWHDINIEQPPLFEAVLLAVKGEAESSEGYRNSANRFIFTDQHEAEGVYAWAKLPACPKQLPAPTLKPLRTRSVKKGGRA